MGLNKVMWSMTKNLLICLQLDTNLLRLHSMDTVELREYLLTETENGILPSVFSNSISIFFFAFFFFL